MQSKSRIMLRVLLNRYHRGPITSILNAMPKIDSAEIMNLDFTSDAAASSLIPPEERIKKIHYSWFSPLIQSQPEALQSILISAFPEPHFSRLKTLLKKNISQTELAPPIKAFFINRLYCQLENTPPLPLEFLPQTELSPLLEIGKDELIELITFLGLFDLIAGVRQIIDKTHLKKIYSCLNNKKQLFIRTYLHSKDKVFSAPLDLQHWNGDCQALDHLLHQRGLLRLGKALCGQHIDFLWHITHTLDTGRAALLNKHYSKEEVPGITPALAQQVMDLLKFLKKANSP